MAGEWRNQALLVAEGCGRHSFGRVIQPGHRAVCALDGFCGLQTIGQIVQTNRTNPSGQSARFARARAGEQPAHIDQGIFDPGQANIGTAAQMHLEVIVQRERTEMLFESNPWRGSEGAASAGYYAPLGGFRSASLLRAQVAAGSGESLGHFGIELEATQT